MVYNKAKWIAEVKKAVADLKAENSPTSGKVCAVATLRYVRDSLVDDVVGNKPKTEWSEEDQIVVETITTALNALIKVVSAKTEDGFASNASAAAKAAGFTPSASVAGVVLDE